MSKQQKKEKISKTFLSLLPRNIKSKAYIKNIIINQGKNKKTFPNNNVHNTDNILEKSKLKEDPLINEVIYNLLRTEKELKQKITKFNYNEKLLKSNSYINIFNKSPQNISKDKTFIKEKINFFEKSKDVCLSKLNYIKSQIDMLYHQQNKISGQLDKKINSNLTQLNKSMSSQNIFEKKMKDLQVEHRRRTLAMEKDLKISNGKKLRKIYELKKEQENKKNEILKNMRDKEREDIKNRKNKNMENVINLRKYINVKPKNENYLYKKILKNYLDKELFLVKKENLNRKNIMKHINSQEFIEMEKNYLDQKEQHEIESKQKIQNLKQEWAERQKLLPTYINSYTKRVNEENEKIAKEKELKIQKIKELKNNQIEFSKKLPCPIKLVKEKILKNKQPQNNQIFNRFFVNSKNYSDVIRKKNYSFRKIKIKIKEGNKSFDNSDKSIISDRNKDDRKNKKIKIYDYLLERRNLKKEKYGMKANDIRKYLKNNGLNETTLDMAKRKLEYLDEQKNQKLRLLNYKGGIAKNPELTEEMFDIMFDAINARISLIEEIDNKFNGNNNEDNDEKHLNRNEKNKSNLNKEADNNIKNGSIDKNFENKNEIKKIESSTMINNNKNNKLKEKNPLPVKEEDEDEEVEIEEEIEEEVEVEEEVEDK